MRKRWRVFTTTAIVVESYRQNFVNEQTTIKIKDYSMIVIIKLTEGAVIVGTLDQIKEGRALGGGKNLRKVPLKLRKTSVHFTSVQE